MWRIVLFVVMVGAVALFGFSLVDVGGSGTVGATSLIEAPQPSIEGFSRAVDAWDWQFPQDFGAHPDFQTEWWYYTGNLKTPEGEHFGFQFTIFRRAIAPTTPESDSEWRDNQIYMAHFTVSDIARQKFYHDERYARSGAGLAGATTTPRYNVWLEDWQVVGLDEDARNTRITAQSDAFSVDLMLEQLKAPVLQGNNGLSPKSEEVGNASYYYSLTRLATNGTITIGETAYSVSGVSWKDHEFSTSALGQNAQGWDWFGLIFDDGQELMLGQIRLSDGNKEGAFGGKWVFADGTSRYLSAEDFTITPTSTWQSPHTNAVYPSSWQITIQNDVLDVTFTVTPLTPDQELHGANVEYWEGAVRVTGDVTGYGYAELTGYVDTMQGRF